MTRLEELKEKRKSALIVVCTLGLAAILMERIRPLWMDNIFEGMSFNHGIAAPILKAFSLVFMGGVMAAVFFVIYFIKLIYYQIEIWRIP